MGPSERALADDFVAVGGRGRLPLAKHLVDRGQSLGQRPLRALRFRHWHGPLAQGPHGVMGPTDLILESLRRRRQAGRRQGGR